MRFAPFILLLSLVAVTARASDCTDRCDADLTLALQNCAVTEANHLILCENQELVLLSNCEVARAECELACISGDCGQCEQDYLACVAQVQESVSNCRSEAAANRVLCDEEAGLAHVSCIDGCRADCDDNGLPDALEVAQDPSLDCNHNGLLDTCEIAGFHTYAEVPLAAGAFGVSSDGLRAYFTSPATGAVTAIDVSSPLQPTVVGTGTAPGGPNSSLPVGDHLYVGSIGSGLYVLDLSTVGSPPAVATLATVGTLPEAFGIVDMAFRDDTLYLALAEGQLEFWVVDVTDRANPLLVSILMEPLGYQGVVLSGNYAFLATLSGGLVVADVTDPANPFVVLQVPFPENATDIAALDVDHVLISYRTTLQVVDITTPTAPVVIATVASLNDVRSVLVDGKIAYVTTADGVLAYDVSTPSSPALRAQGLVPTGAHRAATVQERLVIAGGDPGALVYNTLALDADSDTIPDECGVVTAAPTPQGPSFALRSAVPNPFNPSTTIAYSIARGGPVTLTVHDLTGRHVRTLRRGVHDPGEYSVIWNGVDATGHRVASGVYIYRLTAGDFEDTKRMVLLK